MNYISQSNACEVKLYICFTQRPFLLGLGCAFH